MKNTVINDKIQAYEKEEITLDELNTFLSDYNLFYDPTKQVIATGEAAHVVDGKVTDGYAMVHMGVGSPEKMKIVNGKLEYEVGKIHCYTVIDGVTFTIDDGETLVKKEG